MVWREGDLRYFVDWPIDHAKLVLVTRARLERVFPSRRHFLSYFCTPYSEAIYVDARLELLIWWILVQRLISTAYKVWNRGTACRMRRLRSS